MHLQGLGGLVNIREIFPRSHLVVGGAGIEVQSASEQPSYILGLCQSFVGLLALQDDGALC